MQSEHIIKRHGSQGNSGSGTCYNRVTWTARDSHSVHRHQGGDKSSPETLSDSHLQGESQGHDDCDSDNGTFQNSMITDKKSQLVC